MNKETNEIVGVFRKSLKLSHENGKGFKSWGGKQSLIEQVNRLGLLNNGESLSGILAINLLNEKTWTSQSHRISEKSEKLPNLSGFFKKTPLFFFNSNKDHNRDKPNNEFFTPKHVNRGVSFLTDPEFLPKIAAMESFPDTFHKKIEERSSNSFLKPTENFHQAGFDFKNESSLTESSLTESSLTESSNSFNETILSNSKNSKNSENSRLKENFNSYENRCFDSFFFGQLINSFLVLQLKYPSKASTLSTLNSEIDFISNFTKDGPFYHGPKTNLRRSRELSKISIFHSTGIGYKVLPLGKEGNKERSNKSKNFFTKVVTGAKETDSWTDSSQSSGSISGDPSNLVIDKKTPYQLNRGHYFSNLQESLTAYLQGRLQTHTPFWVRLDYSVPDESKENFCKKGELFGELFHLETGLNKPIRKKGNIVSPLEKSLLEKKVVDILQNSRSCKSVSSENKTLETFQEIYSRKSKEELLEKLDPLPDFFENFQEIYSRKSSQDLCGILFQEDQKNVFIEANDGLEAPLEVRLGAQGNLVKIFKSFQNHFTSKATLLDQCKEKSVKYMRTTAGRVVINERLFRF